MLVIDVNLVAHGFKVGGNVDLGVVSQGISQVRYSFGLLVVNCLEYLIVVAAIIFFEAFKLGK